MISNTAVFVQPRSALAGSLALFGLGTLLTILEMERRSGVLELRGAGRSGRLAVRRGQVIDASVASSPLGGRDAVFELLRWTEGRFAFREHEVEGLEDQVCSPTPHLLLEAARRADEVAA